MFGPWPKGFGRHHYLLVSAIVFASATFASEALSQTLSEPDAERRDEAVREAREGNYAEPLATLSDLVATYPQELSLLHDYVTIVAWSGDHAEVVAIAEPLVPENAPRYVQLAVAKSARDTQRFGLAASWYEAAIAADPNDRDALIGRLLTAGDAVDTFNAYRLSEDLEDRGLDGIDVDLARAYAFNAIGEPLSALSAYDSVLHAEPGHREALRGKALALRSLLLPTQALELEARYPGILTAEEIERLRADEAAINFRLTARTPYLPGTQYENRDRAITLIDERLDATTQPSSRRSLLLDRIVALNEANEAEAAVAVFESLPDSESLDQPYVLIAVAKSYQQVRQPEEALALVDRAVALAPDNADYQLARVYALLDLERYDEAFELTQKLLAELPRVRQAHGSNVIKGNEVWLRAELVAGITESYGDQLDAAQARFEAVLREAPNNSDFRNELANIYRWRGWLDRSLAEYQRVLTMEDEVLSAQIGFAHSRMDARDYREAASILDDLTENHARNPGVIQLTERWRIHNERELWIWASSGESSGPISGSNNYTIDARWYTAPLGYRFRALVATHDGYGEFPEGEGRRRRLGAGLEFRSPRFVATGIVSGSRSGGGDVGIAGDAAYRLSDYWSLNGSLEWNSDNVQLRAHRLGLEADRAALSARFAPHELASVGFGIERLDYSDDNALKSLYADGRRRVINRPRSKLNATGRIAFGSADTQNAPYFSPTSDRSFMLGLEHELRLYRRYERGLTQTVSVGSGRYYQSGFAGGSIWSLAYRIDWSLSQRLGVGLGAERHGQFFDGLREHTTVGTVSVTGRF
jgi:biofilm PGA synthesis protein PgaA